MFLHLPHSLHLVNRKSIASSQEICDSFSTLPHLGPFLSSPGHCWNPNRHPFDLLQHIHKKTGMTFNMQVSCSSPE